MTEDQRLLFEYQRSGSRAALDELVRRHAGLVYSAALRQVWDVHLAEDVTQAVFLVLTKKAGTIRSGAAIGGWLLATTRRAVVDLMRKERAQRRREKQAAKPECEHGDEAPWVEIAPILDAAMNDLPAMERDAVVLRFFENRSFVEVGMTLRLSEDAARKRVERGLDRLRGLLARRGVTKPMDGLATILVARAIAPAPAHVVNSMLMTAAGPKSVSIAKGVIYMMAKAKAGVMAGVLGMILLCGGVGALLVNAVGGQPIPAAPNAAPAGDDAASDQANRPFHYAGMVVDDRGKPIPNVKVTASYQFATGGMGYIDVVKTDAAGRFVIDRQVAYSGAKAASVASFPVELSFDHQEFVYTKLGDLRQIPAESLTDLHITLRAGNTFRGKAVDPSGAPVDRALVEATFGSQYEFTRMTTTAGDGSFILRGLPDAEAKISVLSIVPGSPMLSGFLKAPLSDETQLMPLDDAGYPDLEKAKAMKENAAMGPITLTLQAIDPPASAIHTLFGMKLADVDQTLADELFLSSPHGVVVLDTGRGLGRLKIGDLQRGDQFWMVGPYRIADFYDMVDRLIKGCQTEQNKHPNATSFSVRNVYNFIRNGQSGSNTQYMSLTNKDLDELMAAQKQ